MGTEGTGWKRSLNILANVNQAVIFRWLKIIKAQKETSGQRKGFFFILGTIMHLKEQFLT